MTANSVSEGDVTKVGTPANNQIAVWTGDGTIEGDSDVTWDGTTLKIVGVNAVYSKVLGLLVSSLSNGRHVQFYFGKVASANNVAEFNFNYVSNGNSSNSMTLGVYGALVLSIYGNRDVKVSDGDFYVEGKTRLGDQNTNYTELSGAGLQTMVGNARVTRDEWLFAGAINAPHTNPAGLVVQGLCSAWQFADAVEVNQEHVCALMKTPVDMDITSSPSICVGWSAEGVSPGDCEWQLEYLWTSPNESTVGSDQTTTITSTASATSNGLVIAQIAIQSPSATDVCLHLKLTRLSANGNDTIGDTVELSGVALSYISNKLGKTL